MAKLNPEVLEWAVRRSGLSDEQIVKAFPKYHAWIVDGYEPTVKQIRDFAKKVHVNVSELFGANLPDYALQIADFRSVDNKLAKEPSPELFDTIESMRNRQVWMRDYFIAQGYAPVAFVGSYCGKPTTNKTIIELGKELHEMLDLDEGWAASCKNASEALRVFKDRVEASGISVVINGVVDDNTHRPLDYTEFRGFVLSDPIAPLIFLNGNDYKTAQIFTLAHELCHLAFSQTGVSSAPDDEDTPVVVEQFCNAVAAEFLIPGPLLERSWKKSSSEPFKKTKAIASACKINFMVVARKAAELSLITQDEYHSLCRQYSAEKKPYVRSGKSSGGDYFLTKKYRLGSVFSDAVITAVGTEYLSYRDAYDLTGLSAPSFGKYFGMVG